MLERSFHVFISAMFLNVWCFVLGMGLCDDCFNFKMFGKKCFFYWDEKRECSQFRDAGEDEPKHKSVYSDSRDSGN